jgi:hypothetical protein
MEVPGLRERGGADDMVRKEGGFLGKAVSGLYAEKLREGFTGLHKPVQTCMGPEFLGFGEGHQGLV